MAGIVNSYSKVKKLVTTPRADLYLLRDAEGAQVVGKIFKSNESCAFQEKIMLKWINELGVPNVVKYVDSYPTESHYFLFTEYCENGNLFEEIRRRQLSQETFSNNEVLVHSYNMLETLSSLHKNSIVHRDIKPQNIFVNSEMQLKLGDFGEAKEVLPQTSNSIRGTPHYQPPELSNRECIEDHDVYKQDVWGLGRVLLEVCQCVLCPYVNDWDQETINTFVSGALGKRRFSEAFIQLLLKMLMRDKSQRIEAAEAFQLMSVIYESLPKVPKQPNVPLLCKYCGRWVEERDQVKSDCSECYYHKECFIKFTGQQIAKVSSLEEIHCHCKRTFTGDTLERVTHPDKIQIQKLFLILRETDIHCIQCNQVLKGEKALNENNQCYMVKCPADKVRACSLCGYRGGHRGWHRNCPERINMAKRFKP